MIKSKATKRQLVEMWPEDGKNMNDQEFADRFFQVAKIHGYRCTSRGNIQCPDGKNLSKNKLKAIHQMLGSKCAAATSAQLKQAGVESCCFVMFKAISGVIY